VAPDCPTFEPNWIERLLRPLLRDGRDLVLPVYRRHKFEGLLIRNLVYPMTRTIYKCSVREPYPADFAFSGTLGSRFLAQDIWTQDQGRYGTELWLTLSAIVERCKVTQSFLGTKTRSESGPADLVKAMRESAGVVFGSLEANFAASSSPRQPLEVPCIACAATVTLPHARPATIHPPQVFAVALSN